MTPDKYDIEVIEIIIKFKEQGAVGLPTLDRILCAKYRMGSDFLIDNELQAPGLRRRLDRLINSGFIIQVPPKNGYMVTDEGEKLIS